MSDQLLQNDVRRRELNTRKKTIAKSFSANLILRFDCIIRNGTNLIWKNKSKFSRNLYFKLIRNHCTRIHLNILEDEESVLQDH